MYSWWYVNAEHDIKKTKHKVREVDYLVIGEWILLDCVAYVLHVVCVIGFSLKW